MSRNAIVEKLEAEQLKSDIPNFSVGDTVRVHTKIVEGKKERIQIFEGTVIARKGSGLSETFSVYRIAFGEAMEKVFILHSPRVVKIEVTRFGKTRRAKLYNLRGKKGKAARVKERIVAKKAKVAAVVAEPAAKEEAPAVEAVETPATEQE